MYGGRKLGEILKKFPSHSIYFNVKKKIPSIRKDTIRKDIHKNS